MLTTLRPSEHHEDYPGAVTADSNLAAQLRRDDNRAFKERVIQIRKIQPVTCNVGQAFWFAPDDLHRIIS